MAAQRAIKEMHDEVCCCCSGVFLTLSDIPPLPSLSLSLSLIFCSFYSDAPVTSDATIMTTAQSITMNMGTMRGPLVQPPAQCVPKVPPCAFSVHCRRSRCVKSSMSMRTWQRAGLLQSARRHALTTRPLYTTCTAAWRYTSGLIWVRSRKTNLTSRSRPAVSSGALRSSCSTSPSLTYVGVGGKVQTFYSSACVARRPAC